MEEKQLFSFQEIGNFAHLSTCRRPVICHLSDSYYQLVTFLPIANLTNTFELVQPDTFVGD
jgi:hypothetical protein